MTSADNGTHGKTFLQTLSGASLNPVAWVLTVLLYRASLLGTYGAMGIFGRTLRRVQAIGMQSHGENILLQVRFFD